MTGMVWLNKFYSRRTPLLIIIAVILTGNFGISNCLSYQSSIETMRRVLIDEELPMISQGISSEIKLDLLPIIIASSRLTNDLFIRQWLTDGEPHKDTVINYLDKIRQEYNATTCFLVSDLSSSYYNANGCFPISWDNPDAAWYYSFKKSGKATAFNSTLNTDMNNMPTIFINNRMEDSTKRFTGVVGMGIALKSIPAALDKYRDKFDRSIYFIDAEGNVITHSSGAIFRGKNIRELPVAKESTQGIFSNPTHYFEYKADNETLLISSRYLEELNWWVLIEQKESMALREIHRLALTNITFNLSAIILTMLLLFLAISHFHKQLASMASTDNLTGISNRQVFDYAVTQALARFVRHRRPFCILLLDLDHFKQINDSLGHLEGDQALIKTANLIGRVIRESDDFARWGGEEFVILAHDCGIDQALELAEKIRDEIRQEVIACFSDGAPLTVSIGVSEVTGDDTKHSLLSRADNALYQAKESGRNCVRHI